VAVLYLPSAPGSEEQQSGAEARLGARADRRAKAKLYPVPRMLQASQGSETQILPIIPSAVFDCFSPLSFPP